MNIDRHAVKLLVERGGAIVWSIDTSMRLTSLRGQDDLTECLGTLHRKALGGESSEIELVAAGHTYTVRIDPLREPGGAIVGCVGVAQDVTAERVDAITQLPNRRQMHQHLADAVAHALHLEEDLGVLLVDVDAFRIVNAAAGQAAGDALLNAVAQRIATCAGGHLLSRTGDNEFTVIVAGDDADGIAATIHSAFQFPFDVDDRELHVTASIGIATLLHDGETAEVLLRAASAALRRAKERGGNQRQHASTAWTQAEFERLHVERRLRRAITDGELSLAYQPQVRLHDGAIIGLEALLRWNRDGQIIPAGAFIGAVEQSAVIIAVGDWVIGETCRQIAKWRRAGVTVPRIAINIGARHFQQPRLVTTIRRLLELYDVEASAIELEITETAAMQDAESTVRTIDALRALGLAITIDDFGTGYSSLAYLKRFAITGLKIDRSFVSDVPSSRSASAIVNAILATAHALDLRVVAEGVETQDQATFLAASHCDQAQGYLYAHPIHAEDIPAYLHTQKRSE